MKKLSVSLSKKEIIFGILYFAIQLLVLPELLSWGNWIFKNPFSVSELNFIFFALNFIVITIAFRDFLISNFKILLQNPWRVFRYAGAGFLFYMVASFMVNLVIIQLFPNFFNINDQTISQMTQDNYVLIGIGTVLLVPVVEETLFRGVFFGALYQKKPYLGYLVSTVIFALVHIIRYIGTASPLQLALCFVQYLPAGICLGWSYCRADSIWAPILIHIAVNQIGNISLR